MLNWIVPVTACRQREAMSVKINICTCICTIFSMGQSEVSSWFTQNSSTLQQEERCILSNKTVAAVEKHSHTIGPMI